MVYTASSQGANANPASTFAATMQTLLVAAGFTFVETWTSATITAHIFKSPAASNVQNADWYLGLYRTSDSALQLQLMVAEVWDTGTKKFRNYAPTPGTFTPTSVFAVNDATGLLPSSNTVFKTTDPLLSAAGFQYWVSANPNRVVIGTRVGTNDYAAYAGLYDDLLPAAISPFPLICCYMIGYTVQAPVGSATREPNTTTSTATYCFGVQPNSFSVWGLQYAGVDIYQSKLIASRMPLSSCRATLGNGSANGIRGLFKDIVYCAQPAANGDTLTVTDSLGVVKTYTACTNNSAIGGTVMHTWVDQGA